MRINRDRTDQRFELDCDSGRSAASDGRLPDFLIIGAAKSGTTSVYQYLLRHPKVFLSTPKEPCFFSDDSIYARGEEWYRGLFREASESDICGEATTDYARWPNTPDVPSRIARVIPTAKLVYIMRHPVDRAYSWYGHEQRNRVTTDFESFLSVDSRAIYDSMYMRQIERYLRFFSRDQIHLMIFEDFTEMPDRELQELQYFLGLPLRKLTEEGLISANPGRGMTYARRQLSDALGKLAEKPGLSAMRNVIPKRYRTRVFWWLYHSWFGRRYASRHRQSMAPLTTETRRELLRTFEDSTSELEEFLGRRLPEWHV